MMYGFGDDQNPYTETIDLLEDLVLDFITDTVRSPWPNLLFIRSIFPSGIA